MSNLGRLELADILAMGAPIRGFSAGSGSIEEGAQRVIEFLFDRLGHDDGKRPGLALARLYMTRRYDDLDAGLQGFARGILGGTEPRPDTKCLVLMATRGEDAAWNDRKRSQGHQAIPLPDPEFVERIPMVSEVFRQLGVDVQEMLRPGGGGLPEFAGRQFNVFFEPAARGSRFIPAQDGFVIPHGVESVVAFGGVLPAGDLFVTLLFSKVRIAKETAELFSSLGLSVKLMLMSLGGANLFRAAGASS